MLTVAGQRRTCDRSHRLRLSIVLDLVLSLDLPGIKAPKLSIQLWFILRQPTQSVNLILTLKK